ncbi:hypothetical protein [Candidatus Protofrankia datiscae]|uniref:hypothetical protein n=1 Tax=Candidatus Protofrankia datiscae TaxID=2716812 RepID=UPI0013ECD9C4|nr:hypothetical protein [Candidatus Protofrankia datiscae]
MPAVGHYGGHFHEWVSCAATVRRASIDHPGRGDRKRRAARLSGRSRGRRGGRWRGRRGGRWRGRRAARLLAGSAAVVRLTVGETGKRVRHSRRLVPASSG